MLAEGFTFDDLDAQRVTQMVREDNQHHPEHLSANENVSAVVRFLEATGRLSSAPVVLGQPAPAEACLAEWLRFLEIEHGQGPSWVIKARRLGEAFLNRICNQDGELCWERVDVAMANDLLGRVIAGYSSSMARCSAVRCLLTWSAANGWIDEQVAVGVLSPRRVRTGLPKGLTVSEIAALKNAVDLETPTGRRDIAVIIMLSRLGVRAGEVAGLRLEDIDWREPSIRVVGKGRRILVLPMPVDVGDAVVQQTQAPTPT